MNVGDKLVKFIPAIWYGFVSIVLILMATRAFNVVLSEEGQTIVAVSLLFVLVGASLRWVGQWLDLAHENIEKTHAREDGLTMKRPGLGYLRSAHREVHS